MLSLFHATHQFQLFDGLRDELLDFSYFIPVYIKGERPLPTSDAFPEPVFPCSESLIGSYLEILDKRKDILVDATSLLFSLLLIQGEPMSMETKSPEVDHRNR